MKRMIVGTVVAICTIALFIIGYTVIVIPLEYTVDTLQGTYSDISDDMGWGDKNDVNNTMGMLPYFLAGAVIVGILFTFVWLFAYAHKKEYEQY